MLTDGGALCVGFRAGWEGGGGGGGGHGGPPGPGGAGGGGGGGGAGAGGAVSSLMTGRWLVGGGRGGLTPEEGRLEPGLSMPDSP